jgi:hypothetical protein
MKSNLAPAALGLFMAASAAAQCTPDWIVEDCTGVDGRIYAQVVYDPDAAGTLDPVLVLGGDFLNAGTVTATRLATWNGTDWSALGAGMNGTVRALTLYNGNLVAAGAFTIADGTPASSVALYDGTDWLPLGAGLNGPAYALTLHNGDLYAAGAFTQAGGQPASAIARWDGSSWYPVGTGINGPVYSIHSYAGDLYAGGSFSTAGGNAAANIARWNGTAWSPLGSGVTYSAGAPVVKSLLTFGGALIAGGQFTTAGPLAVFSVASWNGASWSALGQGILTTNQFGGMFPAMVDALADFGGALHATGDTGFNNGNTKPLLTRWTGSAWSNVSWNEPSNQVFDISNALAIYQGSLYVVGRFIGPGSGYSNNIARWSGSAWSKVGRGFDSRVYSLCEFNGGIAAGGEFGHAGSANIAKVAFFDNTSWQPLGSVPNNVSQVIAFGPDLVANVQGSGVYRWNGSAWSPLGTFGSFPQPDGLHVVNGELFATVRPNTFSAPISSAIARWDGAGWVAFGGGVTNCTSLIEYNGEPVAAATFPGLGNVIARWNGLTWLQLTPNYQGTPQQLVVHKGQLTANWIQSSQSRIATWNGTSWTQLGGVFNTVFSGFAGDSNLLSLNNKLYAAGSFTMIDAVPFNKTAVWDGTAWSPLGSGLTAVPGLLSNAQSIAPIHGNVGFAGEFTYASGHRTGFVAYWGCPSCYADCDGAGGLTANDFACFLNAYANAESYANCDGIGGLTANDFACFLNAYAAGCP